MDNINELAKALSGFQAECKPVAYDKVNPHFKNRYSSLSAIQKHIAPLLGKYKLAVTQIIQGENVQTILMHESGQVLESVCPIIMTQKTAQQMGSAITYSRRYALSAILGISADEDEDANIAENKPAAPITITNAKAPASKHETITEKQRLVQLCSEFNFDKKMIPQVLETFFKVSKFDDLGPTEQSDFIKNFAKYIGFEGIDEKEEVA